MNALLLLLALAACRPGDDDKDTPSVHDSDSAAPSEDSHTGDTEPVDDSSGDDTGDDTQADDTHADDTAPPPSGRVVILMIGDGMGFAHVAGGGDYAYGASGTLEMETLPIQNRLRTASLNGVTDSAAAATSYAAGVKTWNRFLGLDRDEETVTSVLETARDLGMSVGVVTTDTLAGATPSAFMVHVSNRGDTLNIVEQIAAQPPDVLLGGSAFGLEEALRDAGVTVVKTADELDAAEGEEGPLAGLFSEGALPWVVDGYGEAPSLAGMVEAALGRLDNNDAGFFLMVEGARIDHASHGQNEDQVHAETATFDAAIAAARDWAVDRGGDVTLVVTADHECGGMVVADTGAVGETPETEWRWGQHTNADVPVLAMGDRAEVLGEGARLDALWINAVIAAAVEGRDVEDPSTVPLVDGYTDELGDAIATQTHESSFGAGFNQLDALRVWADADGLRVGLDGVFELQSNAIVLLVDMDYGDGTGLGGDGDTYLPDEDGDIETLLSGLDIETDIEGLGFDLALVSIGAREIGWDELHDESGLRGLREPWAYDGDLWWLPSVAVFDDGNIARDGDEALDAADPGETENGMEALVPWSSVFPDGFPGVGMDIAVVALIVNDDGSWRSNQALPPLAADADDPGEDPVPISSVAVLTIDDDGLPVGDPVLVP